MIRRLAVCVALLTGLLLALARIFGTSMVGGTQFAFNGYDDQTRQDRAALADTRSHLIVHLPSEAGVMLPLHWLDARHLLLMLDAPSNQPVVEYALYEIGRQPVRFSEPAACARRSLSGVGAHLACIASGRMALLIYPRVHAARLDQVEARLLPAPAPVISFDLAPDGQHAALITGLTGETRLAVLDIESERASMEGAAFAHSSVWSPDSAHLAYVAGSRSALELRVHDVQRAQPVIAAPLPGAYSSGVLAWHDNATLALYLRRGARADVRLLRLAQGGLERVQDDIDIDGLPAWSPDGAQLAFYDSILLQLDVRRLPGGEGSYHLPPGMIAQTPARWRPCEVDGC